MIIAAWVGTGKSFLKKYKNILDLETTPFRYIYDKIDDYEKFKSSPIKKQKIKNNDFPNNYVKFLLEVIDKYDAVLIPVQSDIIELLIKKNIEFISVFPSKKLKKIYKQRYINRGNTEDFIQHILDVWDDKYKLLKDNNIKIIDIKENEYLEDILINMELI